MFSFWTPQPGCGVFVMYRTAYEIHLSGKFPDGLADALKECILHNITTEI